MSISIQVIVQPLKAIFGDEKYHPTSALLEFPTVEDPDKCWANWNDQLDAPAPATGAEQVWTSYIFDGCGGNCTYTAAPNVSSVIGQLRPPIVVNGSWYFYDYVCDAYYKRGHRVTLYSDGSIGGFDIDKGMPGNGPVDPNATVVDIWFVLEIPHYQPKPDNVDPTADLLRELALYNEQTKVNDTQGEDDIAIETPPGAVFDTTPVSFQGNGLFEGDATVSYCDLYTCSSATTLLLMPNAGAVQCIGACSDAVCCYSKNPIHTYVYSRITPFCAVQHYSHFFVALLLRN